MARGDGGGDGLTGTERALYGALDLDGLRAFLDAWVTARLGSAVARVRFRAGRIDVVWGLDLVDGRAVVVKTHRPPVALDQVRVSHEAQRHLVAGGFPCAEPLAGPDVVDGHVLTAETLTEGRTPDGRDPFQRRLLADGLARHIALLQSRPDLVGRTGPGPSWCQYQHGPWPVPHDTFVDLSAAVPGYAWLDDYGRRVSETVLEHRDADRVVVGHADWYAGNTATADGVLVGTFDWELVADTEAVIAGFAAACFAASSTGGGGLSTPEDVVAFLRDYDAVRTEPLTEREQRTAVAAAAWIVTFNARWQVALLVHGLADETVIALVRDRGEEYLALRW